MYIYNCRYIIINLTQYLIYSYTILYLSCFTQFSSQDFQPDLLQHFTRHLVYTIVPTPLDTSWEQWSAGAAPLESSQCCLWLTEPDWSPAAWSACLYKLQSTPATTWVTRHYMLVHLVLHTTDILLLNVNFI